MVPICIRYDTLARVTPLPPWFSLVAIQFEWEGACHRQKHLPIPFAHQLASFPRSAPMLTASAFSPSG
jgi:hypothetical protein